MTVKLYNTLSRKKEVFKPLKPGRVGIYSCGPTVYSNQHLGNMYAYLQWDVLVRFLKYLKYKVKWVVNVTDVGHLTSDQDHGEDKMEKGARQENISVWKIADKYTKQFLTSMDLLNIKRPDVLCRASKHIKEQIELIKKMESKGFTYKTNIGLVFDTSKFPDYSKFAGLKLKEQYFGSRVRVDPEKKQPQDFLLWITNQPNHIMQWDSPWGKGFPGWHIECTAMSKKYLGSQFDIHTGGKEHIPVHHTNEIAQAYGAFGKKTAKYWLHNEWLLIKNEKASKSLGNIILVADLIEKGFNPLSFRYLALTSHYKKGLNFKWQALQASQNALNNLYEKVKELKTTEKGEKKIKIKDYQNKFTNYLSDNLNTPKALALVWEIIKSTKLAKNEKYKLILEFDKVLGLNLDKIKKATIPIKIINLAKQRETFRKKQEWQKADEIRKKIEQSGYGVEDTPKGIKVKKIK